ncbi:hypothetical protein [Paenibacillus polymyxa]|uniref:hypothetical protein n=1 Tax=Paenibacillus polymyxa TaxID=1406 RepID=UPI002ECFE40C|nr:hypothetical protein [Paenibacillus polymyxa]
MTAVYDNEYFERVGKEIIDHMSLDNLIFIRHDGDRVFYEGSKDGQLLDLVYRIEGELLYQKIDEQYKRVT